MNNLRDLLGYALDAIDVFVVRHRDYRYCQLVGRTFSREDTLVSRYLQRFYRE